MSSTPPTLEDAQALLSKIAQRLREIAQTIEGSTNLSEQKVQELSAERIALENSREGLHRLVEPNGPQVTAVKSFHSPEGGRRSYRI